MAVQIIVHQQSAGTERLPTDHILPSPNALSLQAWAFFLPGFLVSTDGNTHASEGLGCKTQGDSSESLVRREEGVLSGQWAGLPECSCWLVHSDMGFTGRRQGVGMQ